jgi:hypothetical protein
MSLADDIAAYKLSVKTRILDKTRPNSITLQDETSCWWELADLFLNIANRVVYFNSDKIPFVTTDDSPSLVLDNYHDNYYPLYGNNPWLFIYDLPGGPAQGDFGAVPNITYEDDDETKDILSISFDFSRGTNGFLQISGQVPFGIPPTTGPVDLTFTASNLLDDGFGSLYLPNALLVNRRPILTMSNGKSVNTQYDKSVTPAGLYGFDTSTPQDIIVTVI